MVTELIDPVLSPGDNARQFHEEGVFNYSTMLLREDLNLLVVGAREAIFALDLNDISKKSASVRTTLACSAYEQNPFIARIILLLHFVAFLARVRQNFKDKFV